MPEGKCEYFDCDLPGRYTDPSLDGKYYCEHHRRRQMNFNQEQKIRKLEGTLRGLSKDQIAQIAKEGADSVPIALPQVEIAEDGSGVVINHDICKQGQDIEIAIRKGIERAFLVNRQIFELENKG